MKILTTEPYKLGLESWIHFLAVVTLEKSHNLPALQLSHLLMGDSNKSHCRHLRGLKEILCVQWDNILILIYVIFFSFLPVFFPFSFLPLKQIMGSTLMASGEVCVRTENRKNMRVFLDFAFWKSQSLLRKGIDGLREGLEETQRKTFLLE